MKKQIAIVSTILVVALIGVFAFAACTPSLDSLKEKYTEAGYGILDLNIGGVIDYIADQAGDDVEVEEASVEYGFVAVNANFIAGEQGWIAIVAFNDGDAFDKMKTFIEENTSLKMATKGKAIAIGSESAIELF